MHRTEISGISRSVHDKMSIIHGNLLNPSVNFQSSAHWPLTDTGRPATLTSTPAGTEEVVSVNLDIRSPLRFFDPVITAP